MKLRALLTNDETKKEAEKIIKYAEKNIVTLSKTKLIRTGDLLTIGDNPNHVQHIFEGFRVVYSIEEQPDNMLFHRISVSVDTKGKYPSIPAVQTILELYNMSKDLENDSIVWNENIGEFKAINVLQKKNQ